MARSTSEYGIIGAVMGILSPFVLLVAGAVGSLAQDAAAPPPTQRLVLVGDSTVQDHPAGADRAGWGQVFGACFVEGVEVVNLARGGTSSKSYRGAGRWDEALARGGDYVFIQFGHNDCPGKGERSTDPATDYQGNLRRYVDEARGTGARPVLVTPVARRTFDPQGKITTTLRPYADAMLRVAAEQGVPVVDLHARSIAAFERLGDAGSAWFSPGPGDRSHFSPRGARVVAGLVASGVHTAVPALRGHLLVGDDRSPASVEEAVDWLAAESQRLIRAARRDMQSGIGAFPPQVGIGYEAFWLRDYAYMLEGCSEAFTDEELRDACLLFVRATRADGYGVDCVKYDGTPIYKPGYGSMGREPVTDGGMFTVAVAWHTHQRLRDLELLASIADRLVATMDAVPRHPETGLVHIGAEGWERCPYGFTDTVHKQGDLLFSSLLWIEAAARLAELLGAIERSDEAERFAQQSDALAEAVRRVLWDEERGLFRAATLRCAQPDLWGSAFAVHLGVASEMQATRVARYFQLHYDEVVQHGQLRHLPGGEYWEEAGRRDHYQNGAYWATPTGWLALTLDRVDPRLARRTLLDLVADFRERGVCEWVLGETTFRRDYLASATLPLAGARALSSRGGQ